MSSLEKNLYQRVKVSSNNTSGTGGIAYKGFSTVDITRDSFSLYDFELIKQDIINHFHIRKGEKFSDPRFGTIIWDVLFEPFTPELEEAIIKDVQTIITYDPRVTADSILVSSYESGILIEATIEIVPYKIKERLSFKFDQSAGFIN